MSIEEIQLQIDNILSLLSQNPVSDIVEYTQGDKTIKKRRQELRDELAFWRAELVRVNQPKRKILTRF